MHTDASLSRGNESVAYHEWLRFIESISDGNEQKFEFFKQLIKFPLVTTSITANVYRSFKRIFHGADSRRDFQFSNPEFDEEFRAFSHLKKRWFETEGFKHFKSNPNGFLWVNIPSEESEKPEPYFKYLGLDSLVCADIDESGRVYYAIFSSGEDFLVFDSEKVAITDDKGNIKEQVLHQLGEPPIRQFWSTNLGRCKYIKDTPVASVLGDLDYILLADVGKENVDLYAKFPFISLVEDEESYQDFKTEYEAMYGVTGSEGEHESNVSCLRAWETRKQQKRFRNIVGSVLKRQPPKDGESDISNPFEIISPDTTALEHLINDIDQRTEKVIFKMTGHVGGGATTEAINEKQVASEVDSKQDVLNEIKRNFEIIETWAYEICGLYMYNEKPLVSVNYGTKFFLKTTNQVEQEYANAKAAGVSEGYLVSLLEEVIMTKHQNNPVEQDKQLAILTLDPLPTYTIMEAYKMGVPDDIIMEKANLNRNVDMYEAQTGNRIGALSKDELLNLKQTFKDGESRTTIRNENTNPKEEAS